MYQHKAEKKWASKSYELETSQVELSQANAVRESMRDMLRHRSQMCDTIMILDTLILGFAFDFVYNGTLPPYGNNNPWMPAWSALMCTSQTITFWSIYFMCRIKYKLDCFTRLMRAEQDDRGVTHVETWIHFTQQFTIYWENKCQNYYSMGMAFFWIGMLLNCWNCVALMVRQDPPPLPCPFVHPSFVHSLDLTRIPFAHNAGHLSGGPISEQACMEDICLHSICQSAPCNAAEAS
jgi:hypothetical protein